MSSPGSFEVLAELSIALVGFAGVVVVLGRSSLPGAARRFRLVLLFANGSTALWGALTPSLSALLVQGEPSWRLAGMLYLPLVLAINGYAWRNFFLFQRDGQRLPMVFYVATPLIVGSLLYLAGSLLLLPSQIPAAQFLSVVLLLFLGLYHFFILTTSIPDES